MSMDHVPTAWCLLRLLWTGLFWLVLVIPGWWLATRIRESRKVQPFFSLVIGIGLSLAAYLSFVNLLGKILEDSIAASLVWLGLNAVASWLLRSRLRRDLPVREFFSAWRAWVPFLVLALIVGFPQWLYAVSTNSWDEAASSAIHWTAANQFSEGVFPPRHNAFPDVPIKYHYGFTMLSGTMVWLSGLGAADSIDLVSTALWLFIWCFVYLWLRELDLGRASSLWGSFATLLGGGLSWLYVSRLEAYSGVYKVPDGSLLLYRYQPAAGWLKNFTDFWQTHSLHMRNGDGTLSHLPWEITSQFQQHPVSLGLALTLVSAYFFLCWRERPGFAPGLFMVNLMCFGILTLAHAVFGGVAAASAGLVLLGDWVQRRTAGAFFRGFFFTLGVSCLAFLHGGLLTLGPDYGSFSFLTLRDRWTYSAGNFIDFLDWNLAGFGIPLILAIMALGIGFWRGRDWSRETRGFISFFSIFTGFSYLVPNLFFYSSDTSRVEEFTEIAKFFFCTHLGIALLSVLSIRYILQFVPRVTLLPAFAIVAIAPLAICYKGAFPDGNWVGFYTSPYEIGGVSYAIEMGKAFKKLKKSNHDTYFDSSGDERKSGYLSELLVYGGSAFTLTPSRYERTGIGYRLAEATIADRLRLNGRVARLSPGAFEEARCEWFYTRPATDMATAPLLVRSRFAKAVSEGYFFQRHAAGPRILYSIERPTLDLDEGIEQYWRPKVILQTSSDWDGDGQNDLIFYDYRNQRILSGGEVIDLPPRFAKRGLVQLYTGSFARDPKVDFLLAELGDTEYSLGKSIQEVLEYSPFRWTYRDSANGTWREEDEHWTWDRVLPVVADLDGNGIQEQYGYRPEKGQWWQARNRPVAGPKEKPLEPALPLGGHFLENSKGELGLWNLRSGLITLRSLESGSSFSFNWGGRSNDVLVPGDYNGDGYDEIGVWQRDTLTWYWKRVPDGSISKAVFGSASGIPLPADYNHDGKLDLAFWEPSAQVIFVSFDYGHTIDLRLTVPPNSIPAFVNMF